MKTVIVTFPGTLGIIQLFEEVIGSSLENFNENSNSPILIGKYFGERAKKLFDIIFNEELDNLMKQKYQIITTGHSLGGAMAQCFMYFAIIKEKISKVNLPMTITYGQPKVGNYFFAKFLDKNVLLNLRFVNKNDIVQKIPLSSGIYHLGYFFDCINPDYTYYHTLNEVEQQKIIKLPNIIKFISYAYNLIKYMIIIRLIIITIIYSGIELVEVIKMDKEWPISDNKTNYIIFIILLVSVSVYYLKNNIMVLKLDTIFIIFITVCIIAILLYTFLIIAWGFIILLTELKKGIDFGLEKVKSFVEKLWQRLLILLIPFVESIMLIFKALGNVRPHTNYQFEGYEIKNEPEKKKILREYKYGEYCDPKDFMIYKSTEDDYTFMIYDKKKDKLITFPEVNIKED